MKNKEPKKNDWTEECEELLAEWSEKASCYRWLHGRSEKSYRKWYYCFSIPVIILSTLTGAANVGMDSFVPTESKSIASAIVGGINIFAGIISTLQNFLKVAELMEAHRIAGVSWGKLQRNIAIELALDRSRRVVQSDFLSVSRSEYDRLIEAGPIIDDKIISQFNSKFKKYEVSIPSICNGLDKCNIYKIDDNNLYNEDLTDGIQDIIEKQELSDNNNINVEIKDINKPFTKDDGMVTKKLIDKEHLITEELDNKNNIISKELNNEELNNEELNNEELNNEDKNKKLSNDKSVQKDEEEIDDKETNEFLKGIN